MIAMEEEFTTWLSGKLRDVGIDDDVLGSYISSIVTSDEPENEKKETIQDLLLGYSEDVDAKQLCCEVTDRWHEMQNRGANEKEEGNVDIVDKVALIMLKQAQPVLKTVNRSTEEEKLREAILTRCTFLSSEEEEEHSDEDTVSSKTPCQNQNAEAVIQAERDRRESQKLEAEKKKVQDKTNREKQKMKQDERREKERKRTQKREHRR